MRAPTRLAAALVCAALLAGCDPFGGSSNSASSSSSPTASEAVLTATVDDRATDVPVDTRVGTTVDGGRLEDVRLVGTVEGKKQQVEGSIEGDSWTAGGLLEPGTRYRLSARAVNDDGKAVTMTRTFTTQALTLEQQTYPSVAPLQGETVGVGMPIVVSFDLPVKDRALYEKNMTVTADQDFGEGSWYWLSDTLVHFRPKEYWPAHAKITVDVKVNSLPTGNGTYGQRDQHISFRTGDRVISRVDVRKHRMVVNVNRKKVRTIPVSTGGPGHLTREGTKVVMEKFSSVDMDAATTGVDSEDPDYYNLSDVRWAMRLTNSGEFIHAAPWSVASQGRANVSHGCTGMSTANAKWLFDRSRRGDVVEYLHSPRPMEPQNGWSDWNVSWSDWQAGSALHDGEDDAAGAAQDGV